jgi:hypothetical protein
MNILKCEFCNNDFRTISALNNHKNKAKYCLIIQGKLKIEEKEKKCIFCNNIFSSKQYLETHMEKCKIQEEKIENKTVIFKCEYCDKILSTKQMLENHKNICSVRKNKEVENLINELKEKNELINKCNTIIEMYREKEKNYKEQIIQQEKNYKEQIKDLQDKLDKIANKAIDKPTIITNTTNNSLNIMTSLDFNNLDKIKDVIQDKLSINHIVDGQKGLAQFVVDTILKDEEGKLLYVCTDPSRNIFKYKNSTGEIKKDVEAKKLTTYILDGGIKTKSVELANKWYKDDNGEINMSKYDILTKQQQSILRIGEDNNVFKKELASITTI